MNASDIVEYSQSLGAQARAASGQMARASAATRSRALKHLAGLLRANIQTLQEENQKDVSRAIAAGLKKGERGSAAYAAEVSRFIAIRVL